MAEGEWVSARDSEGRTYYFNKVSRQTQWEKPTEMYTTEELELKNAGWEQAKTKDGRVYYFHALTRESRWEKPKLESSPAQSSPVQPAALTVELQPSDLEADAKVNQGDAEREFIQMLANNQVDSTWSFDRIISELGSRDKRYWVIEDDPLWKKQMFEKYLSSRTKEQLLKEHMEISKFKDAFVEVLRSHEEISYYTRWITATKTILVDEPIYKHSVVQESIKRQTFEEYVSLLKQEHEAKQNQIRKRALTELRTYLHNILKLESEWITWENLLQNYLFDNNKRFMANKHFQVLTHEDVLVEYLKLLENRILKDEEKLNAYELGNYTRDRRARDSYKALLKSNNLKIKANSRWKDIYPLIKNDTSFVNMLGRKGSSALDLFLDRVDELMMEMRAHTSIVQQAMIYHEFHWQEPPEHSSQDILDFINKHKLLHELSYDDREIVVKALISLRIEANLRKLTEQQNTQRANEHKFKILLRKTFTSNEIQSKNWYAIKDSLEKSTEYKQLRLQENDMQQMFNMIQRSLTEKEQIRTSNKRHLTPAIELDY